MGWRPPAIALSGFLEIGFVQGPAALKLAESFGQYEDLCVLRDYGGNPRVWRDGGIDRPDAQWIRVNSKRFDIISPDKWMF